MKKNTKKLICMLTATMAMSSAVAGIAMFNSVEASAANTASFEMFGGSIRYDEPTGLRFAAQLDVASYEAGVTANATYGMLIFPVNVMQKHGIDYTAYNAETDYISEIETKAADYFEYMESQDKTVVYTVSSQPVAVYKNEAVAYYEIYGSLGDVLYNNLSRDFFAVAYQKIGDDYTYASFENGTNVRSVAYVASAAWADASSTQQTTLNGFLGKAIYQAQGKTEAEAEAELANGNKPVCEAALSETETTLYFGKEQQLTITSEGINLGAKWTSSDSKIVSVDKYGVLTAKGIGTATITANCVGQELTCEVTTEWSLVNELEGLEEITLWKPNDTTRYVYNNGVYTGVYVGNTSDITISNDVRADSTSTQSIRIAAAGWGPWINVALNPVQWAEVEKGGNCYVWIKIEGEEGSNVSFTMSGVSAAKSVKANTWTKLEVPSAAFNNTSTVDDVEYRRFNIYIDDTDVVCYVDDIIVEEKVIDLVNELENLGDITVVKDGSAYFVYDGNGKFTGVYATNAKNFTVSNDVRPNSDSTQSIRLAAETYEPWPSVALSADQWAEVQKGGKCYVWIKMEGEEGSNVSFSMSGTGGATSVKANTWTKVEVPMSVLNGVKNIGGVDYQRFYFYTTDKNAVFYIDDIIVEEKVVDLVNELENLGELKIGRPDNSTYIAYDENYKFTGVYSSNAKNITVSNDVRANSDSTQSIKIAADGYLSWFQVALTADQWAEVQNGGKCYVWIKIEGEEGSNVSFTMSGTGGATSVKANTWTKVEVPMSVLNGVKNIGGVDYQRFNFFINDTNAVIYIDDIIVEKAQ